MKLKTETAGLLIGSLILILGYPIITAIYLQVYNINYGDFALQMVNLPLFEFILAIACSYFVHEVIHLLVLKVISKHRYKDFILCINWKNFIIQFIALKPIKVGHYRLGAIAPLLILGFAPLSLSFFLESPFFLFLAVLNIAICGVDVSVFFELVKEDKNKSITHFKNNNNNWECKISDI